MDMDVRVKEPDYWRYGAGINQHGLAVWVDGLRALPMPESDGRASFHQPDLGVVVKCEHADEWGGPEFTQAAQERDLWDSLEDEDREFFGEILATYLCDGVCYTVQRFYDGLRPAPRTGVCTDEEESLIHLADSLAVKYDVLDWSPRQWKVRPDGRVLIHDFGVSPENG